MSTTYKERTRRALQHEPVDRMATQISYTADLGRKIAAHFNVAVQDLPEFCDNHMVRVDIDYSEKLSPDGRVRFDWWGVGFDVEEEGYFPSVNPLAESKDLDAYPWPDPDAPSLLGNAERILNEDSVQHFVTPMLGFALFERAWTLRGLEAFLMDMVLDPGFVDDLLDRILEIQMRLIDRYIALGVDGAFFGDDYGAQNNMLFSPKMWRRYFKPRLTQMFDPFRAARLPVILHCDGHIRQIVPDLIEIGLTALNPVQPEVLDHVWLRKAFGDRLAYYGGISTQTVLPHGSPSDVKKAVQDCVQNLSLEGTGLVIAPSHAMMTDIPMENIEALLESFEAL